DVHRPRARQVHLVVEHGRVVRHADVLVRAARIERKNASMRACLPSTVPVLASIKKVYWSGGYMNFASFVSKYCASSSGGTGLPISLKSRSLADVYELSVG